MLALSTLCAPSEWSLDRAVQSFRAFDVRAVALHREPSREEIAGLRPIARQLRIVAIFGEESVDSRAVLVVEGGPVGEDREQSLENLCRRLHALREFPVALRTPEDEANHPAPHEIEMVRSSLPNVGYWHDAERGGLEFLEVAQRWTRGASFHPLTDLDLGGIRDALPRGAPGVVSCPPGTSKAEVKEALARARGFFRA